MSEKPILFSGPMVRAILDGSKTMTRRIIKHDRGADRIIYVDNGRLWPGRKDEIYVGWVAEVDKLGGEGGLHLPLTCPYGKAGDRLWVREGWQFLGTDMHRHGRTHTLQDGVVQYVADGKQNTIETFWQNVEHWMGKGSRVRPSIHMPRWASRITLDVTSVRVERLQDITEADALAEGVDAVSMADVPRNGTMSRRADFKQLWDGLNLKRGFGWDINPWVWVIEFSKGK